MVVMGRRLGSLRRSGPFGRCQRLHRQRVDLLAHALTQGLVDPLVAAHPAQAFEFGRDDGGKEMAAVALDLQRVAGKSVGDVLLDFGGGGIGMMGAIVVAGIYPRIL